MNFDDPKSKSDYSDQMRAAPDASADQKKGSQCGETAFGFKATDFVVYAAHGVGQIIAIEEQVRRLPLTPA